MKRDGSPLGLTLLSQHRFSDPSLMHQLTTHFSVRAIFHDAGKREINAWREKKQKKNMYFPHYQFEHTNSLINVQILN